MHNFQSIKIIRCLLAGICLATIWSCGPKKSHIAIIWTDRSEFAVYAEAFNNSQSKYRVHVEYRANPAEALVNAVNPPDIVIGPWLKSEKPRNRLVPVDYLFNELRINSGNFYPSILELGHIKGRQFLLPVSFNLPAIIFSPEHQTRIPGDFTISVEEIRSIGQSFNEEKNGIHTRMGFSPRWEPEFLYLTTRLFNVRFEESTRLFNWNQQAADELIHYLRDWTQTANTSVRAEDDFEFKYLYDPPYTLVLKGRNLFSMIPSEKLFVLPQEKMANLEFRWISRNGNVPVQDEIIYLGIPRKSKNLEAAEQFIIWFFNEKNQRSMLERSLAMGIAAHSFGIAGGFSSLRPVNEKIFPLFYPALLGHIPPAESLSAPRILPYNWKSMKAEIIMPWLIEATSAPKDSKQPASIAERLSEWIKTH